MRHEPQPMVHTVDAGRPGEYQDAFTGDDIQTELLGAKAQHFGRLRASCGISSRSARISCRCSGTDDVEW
jgi:hypothetical protein